MYRHLLLFLCFASVTAFAQESGSYNPPANTWAIQFGISNNFTLSSFQGSMLGIKRQVSEHSGWRLGLGIDAEYGTVNRTSINGALDSTDSFGEGDDEASTLSCSFEYVSYFANNGNIHVYYAAGPGASYSHSIEDPKPVDPAYIYGSYSRQESHSFSAGAYGALGVEWFFDKSMSLHAEYRAFAGYQSSQSRSEWHSFNGQNQSVSENREKKAVFHSNGVRFGLSVYL